MVAAKRGFSIVELMMVVAIMSILAGMGFYMFDVAKQQELVVDVRNTLQRLSEAIEAYHDKTLQYPQDLAADSPNGLGALAGEGYLAVLRGNVGMVRRESGVLTTQSLYFYDTKPEFILDDDHVMDAWGFAIQYRLCPRNTEDYRVRFHKSLAPATATKEAVLGFPGNPKKYNLWSPGKDGLDEGQKYDGVLDPKIGVANGNYKSGGHSDPDAEGDIGNW